MPTNSNGNGASDRHLRAAQALDQAAKHLERCLEGMSALARDSKDVASEVLETGRYPVDRWLPDMLAFSINAWSVVLGCVAHEKADTPSTTQIQSPVPNVVEPERTPAGPVLVFDIKSEMAGPIEFTAPSAPLTHQATTNLTGSAGTIDATHVLVRPVGTKIFITLRDLGAVAPGTYQGAVTLTDLDGDIVTLSLTAVCRATLWWS